MRWLNGITNSMDASSRSWWWTGKPGVPQSMGLQRVGHDWVTELMNECYLCIICIHLYITAFSYCPCCSLGKNTEVSCHFLLKNYLVGKDSDAGKNWRQKEKERWSLRWLENTIDSVDMHLYKLQEIVEDRGAWHAAVHWVTKLDKT